LAASQVQGNVGLTNMPDLKHLDLAFRQVQMHLNLAVSQVQDNIGLANMLDPIHLDLAVSQVQDNNYPPLICPRE
jgi:hypothetical protein